MTRNQLYSQINTELGSNSADRRFDPRTIFLAADTVRGSAIPIYVETHGEDSLPLFCVERILPVQFDSAKGRKYVSLPFQILGMQDNMGLVQVSLPQEDEGSFIGMKNGMLSVYGKLEAGGAAGRTVYWLSGNKIYFNNLTPGATDILVKAIPGIYDLISDDEQIPMPLEFNAIVIEGVKARLMNQPIEDKADDTRAGV